MNLAAKISALLAPTACIATAVLLTSPLPVRADVVFTDLTAGGTYNPSGGFGITGPSHAFQDWDIGSRFVSPANYTLDSVQLALFWGGRYGTNVADVWLMSDVGGYPGAIIESFYFDNLPYDLNTSNSYLVTGFSSAHPVLSAGNQYWLVASALADSEIGWKLNSSGYIGYVFRYNTGPWRQNTGPAAAFSIIGTSVSSPSMPSSPVPEPGSLAVFGAALVVLGITTLTRTSFTRPPRTPRLIGWCNRRIPVGTP